MKRRKFIQAASLTSAIPLSMTFGKASATSSLAEEKELYELRTYEVKFGSNQSLLVNYLKDVLQPALKRTGVNHFILFSEYGMSNPSNLHVLISYPTVAIYLAGQNLQNDQTFNSAAQEYDAIPADRPLYNRYTSSLLLAFDGLPKMNNPIEGASIFELRTYEGYSEDATRRKIKMFNVEEIDLFYKTGLHPVFFGDMISGPFRPSLVYMLGFKDMEERDANWKVFVDHPEWKRMSAKPEYANSVSNIRRLFLQPV
ncbi:NIPSNAP family protein [Fulvivirga sedimenti]|uniref:NIPSNAP family protein n=1 Tax=Fulvivirga sedimenti TaxID=2879465 RepID=A0A9X1HT38_9BACT|nr:NIPSNAP family protein [Fulvivirga sedimenti]MCA6075110.1 NIPSNAP family protein [Fulvivirga sedimenti]MCA6076287.1 NIPSNAP family protein [Fulvivirga sedimenti]MCA6077415.1 NIPSNAP family protein [Fulvivirga sedimenti]